MTKHRTLAEWLAAEPFTLTLSSGFFGFFAHAGMLQALSDAGLRPARITGASAGALVGSAHAAGLSPQRIVDELLGLARHDFWDPAPGLGFLRGARFRERLTRLLPVARFEECAIPLAVSVHEWSSRRTKVMMHGDLVPAIYASCAVPLLFHPLRLEGNLCADGGIGDRWGLAGTRAGERVLYHHLGSRSPWRRAGDPGLQIPERDNLAALELREIPRSGPSKLQLGRQIVAQARAATMQALQAAPGTESGSFRSTGGGPPK
ncbi:MAG: patatin-like phospholipase family protein [Pseudomonadota bacterium]